MPIEIPEPDFAAGPISVLAEIQAAPVVHMGFNMATAAASPLPARALLAQHFNVDQAFDPIPMRPRHAGMAMAGFAAAPAPTAVLRVTVQSRDEYERLRNAAGVVHVWSDPRLAPFPGVDCNSSNPTGDAAGVAAALGAARVWNEFGLRGDGIVIGIVDGGVDATQLPAGATVTGGWSPDPNQPPGSGNTVWGGHGNMCAYDALIACPRASIHDYAIGRAGGVPAVVSAAQQAFEKAIQARLAGNGPHVLSNSWGLYQQSWDPFPPGHPGNYSHNLNHPFNRKVLEAMDMGILVVFAAGNCGASCPSGQCGLDTGPGRSIRGANGSPRVICVGAANLAQAWIGYSSQGPSTLDQEKPDFCGYSHFTGHTPCDNGTSAACPVVAGVLGLMAQKKPSVTQDEARSLLRNTANHPLSVRWDNTYGRGIVDAYAAVRTL